MEMSKVAWVLKNFVTPNGLNTASATCSHLNYFTNHFLKYSTKSILALAKLSQILSQKTMN